ncbi:hypothetical protein RHMOL_Rhmol04G0150500 [Rhododendron molle]|uniref:Uncharacterized protein n=1 Tax=Rhododendron molle TaxID=49168 RepID=A0ACC0P0H9_RHOML|nr:hypothetical protein RHMOL_Rhmol04G0150500 [Rhododendron molle]
MPFFSTRLDISFLYSGGIKEVASKGWLLSLLLNWRNKDVLMILEQEFVLIKDEDWDGEEDSDEDDKSGGDDEVDLDISGQQRIRRLTAMRISELSGFKKVINYTKKVMEDIRYRKRVSCEEVISGLAKYM